MYETHGVGKFVRINCPCIPHQKLQILGRKQVVKSKFVTGQPHVVKPILCNCVSRIYALFSSSIFFKNQTMCTILTNIPGNAFLGLLLKVEIMIINLLYDLLGSYGWG